MYVDCGAWVGPVPRGVGGRDCNDTSRSGRRGREDRGVEVDRKGSFEGVLWVTTLSGQTWRMVTHRRWNGTEQVC